MIFEDFSKFLKPHLASEIPLEQLLFDWMQIRLTEPKPEKSHLHSILHSEFKLINLHDKNNQFVIAPLSGQASYLLKLLRDYLDVMEERRQTKYGITAKRANK